ncbi:MAG TPA: XRE family transcriptional regulator [Gammaproteobacteria bacterium]|nr:XRE family transcriptional regulator [Gammaproteobacteria bacterium]
MVGDLGVELRRLRQAQGLSLRAVEESTSVSNAYLSQLERGQVKNPSPQKLQDLANCYNVPYEDLMRLAGYMKAEESRDQQAGIAEQKRSPKKRTLLQTVLDSANLSPEDEKLAADYIQFLSTRRSSK